MARQLHTGRTLFALRALLLLLCVPAISSAHGQATASPSIKGTGQRAPLHHLYWHFLLYQNHLDRQAAVLEAQGKDGQFLRNHFQKELLFNDGQFGIIRDAGLRLETDLETQDAKIKPILYQDRLWVKQNGRAAGPPPGHSQIQQAQKEREALILGSVTQLSQALGLDLAAKLQVYIETTWAPHVTVHTVLPSRSTQENAINSLPHTETQQ